MLELKNIVCGYGKEKVIENISFSVQKGEVIGILGANGIGKTTLFKSILGHLKLLDGEVLVKGENINRLSRKRLAQMIGYVPQAHVPPFPFKVLDVVTMGRTAHISLFAAPSSEDIRIAKEALESLGIAHLVHRIYTEISGGERQLVLIARALAQKPQMLIMDEPTANLDFGNQVKMLKQITDIANSGLAIIMTTHFPDHVFLCSSKVIVLKSRGEVIIGEAKELINNQLLKEVYGVDIEVKKVKLKNREVMTCIPC